MSIKKVFELLKSQENGTELSDILDKHLDSLKNEAAGRRIENKEVNSELATMKEQLGLVLSSLSKEGDNVPKELNELTTNRLIQDIKDLKDKFEKSETEKQKVISDKQTIEKRNKISELLRDDVSNSKLISDYSDMLANSLEMAEDGVLQTKEGIEAKKYISNFLDERKEILKPNVASGNIENKTVGVLLKDEKDMTPAEKFNASLARAKTQLQG